MAFPDIYKSESKILYEYGGARIHEHANCIQIGICNKEFKCVNLWCKCTYLYNMCLKTFYNVTLIGLFDKEYDLGGG